jgi:hypothetical protein
VETLPDLVVSELWLVVVVMHQADIALASSPPPLLHTFCRQRWSVNKWW